MTSRRQFLVAGALGALSGRYAAAQTRLPRVGMLSGRPLNECVYCTPLIRQLAELGYRDGAGMILEYRSTDGDLDRYPKQARELIDLKCDIIFTIGSHHPAKALRDLRSPIPAVFWAADYDPLEKGLVTSLRRPDGNMTGVYAPQGELVAKRMQILHELVPTARRFLVLADVWSKDNVGAAQKAAASAGVHLTVVEFSKQPYDFVDAFNTARRAGVEGIVLLNSPVFAQNLAEIRTLIAKHRLPSVGSAYPGLLVGYHGDLEKAAARVAALGVRILKGAKPADIPVEQQDEFVLVINAKTARALGVKIPESIMARATRIIQ